MILQQNTNVQIWGKADSKDVVKITPSWNHTTFTVTPDANGKWNLLLPTQNADFKPYTLTITHRGTETTINDVLFGEVWLCSGQSNMEMKMKGWHGSPIKGGREAIANSRNEYIRHYMVEKKLSATEKDDCNGMWQKAEPDNIAFLSYLYNIEGCCASCFRTDQWNDDEC